MTADAPATSYVWTWSFDVETATAVMSLRALGEIGPDKENQRNGPWEEE
jgi:hypothetical protein